MRDALRKIFSPLLSFFERGNEPYAYKPSHRTILLAVGSLFLLLSVIVFVVGLKGEGFGFVLPGVVFGGGSYS